MKIKKEFVPKKLSEVANLEAEQSIIGILLIDEDGYITEEIMLSLQINDFYYDTAQKIFSTMRALFNKGIKIDFVTVSDALDRQLGIQEANIIIDFIIKATNMLIGTSRYKYYIQIIKDYSTTRQIENACMLGLELVKSGKTAESISNELQSRLNIIADGGITDDCEQVIKITENVFEKIKKRANGEYDEFGIETGFKYLDKCLWGLQKSDLIIVAARAGVGKTAFALNIINQVAVKDKKKVAFFSLEMPKNQIIERLFSLGTLISNYDLKAGLLNHKFKEIEEYKNKLKESSLYIDDDSRNTVPKMIIKSKRLQRKEGLDLVVIDYLQFIKPQEKSGNRFQDVGEIARGLKSMARELNVPVVVLCQLNRQLDTEDREPTLADLRESGEIENNADIVMFLHSRSKREDEVKNIDLIIGKYRNGQMKAIRMTYKGDCFNFSEKEKVSERKVEQIELTPIEDDDLPF